MDAFVTGITGEVTDMVTNIGLVAVAGLGIFAVLYGIRLAVKAFRGVAK